MDAHRFDALTRALSTGSRRGLLGTLLALPLFGGLLALLAPDDAEAKGRRKRRRRRHRHGQGRPKNRRKKRKNRKRKKARKRKKRCQAKSPAKVCDGKCGIVQNNCKKKVDCGSCACDPTCAACFTCQERPNTPGACVLDPTRQGEACGAPGQVCQADGVCACDVCADGCPFGSVQEAINAANTGDTIWICAGTYQEPATITIRKDLTLIGVGNGEDGAILDGQRQRGVIGVGSGTTVALQGLRIINGGNTTSGGGVINAGDLTLTDCTVTGSAASDTGGGIYNDENGTLTLIDSTVSGNTAQFGGGLFNFFGIVTLEDGVLVGGAGEANSNTATVGGGGIFNTGGTLTLEPGSRVVGNTASFLGGGIYNDQHSTVTVDPNAFVCSNNPPDQQCDGPGTYINDCPTDVNCPG